MAAANRVSDAVQAASAPPRRVIDVKTELGTDYVLPLEGHERLADQFFVDEWAINLGGIEVRSRLDPQRHG
jgi:hypothetical protein